MYSPPPGDPRVLPGPRPHVAPYGMAPTAQYNQQPPHAQPQQPVPSFAAGAAPQPSGMPPAIAFGFGIVAAVVALVFDVIFLNVHVPGVGGYAWYLTTALSFAGAGYFGIKWTRASQGTAITAVVMAGVLYGAADVGLGLVLEGLTLSSAGFLGIQGLVIACICGGGGVRKALAER